MPKHKEPDTAIINVYDEDDCIPPHIDHHDFDRPFCTISLLSQQNIMFGSRIISRGPGDFVADYEMPLPTGLLSSHRLASPLHCHLFRLLMRLAIMYMSALHRTVLVFQNIYAPGSTLKHFPGEP